MTVTRRHFLQVSSLAGGGFVLGVSLPSLAAGPEDHAAELNAFLRIGSDGKIEFLSPNIEMGQGVFTSHAMVVAEELDADVDRFDVRHAPADPAYNNPFFQTMGTGGSTSTPAFWMPLRRTGAAARAMLIAAAADRWGVAVADLSTDRGRVIGPGGKTLDYGELAAAAAGKTPPEDPPLKDPSQFRIIGKSIRRVEGEAKVTGRAQFGIDLSLPGMLTAVVVRPPVFRGPVGTVRNAAEVRKMAGVRGVKPIDSGIAVLADSYWQARQGARRLQVDWPAAGNDHLSTEDLFARFERLAGTPGAVAATHGSADRVPGSGEGTRVEGTFRFPYLAHAPMEPLNATARVGEGEAEVWAGTYLQLVDRQNVATQLGIDAERVQIHTQLAGGAFGRRANASSDFIIDAVQAAKGENVPVKVVWSREDDIRGGMYRPLTVHRIEAELGADGRPAVWHQRIVSQSIAAGTPFEPAMVHDGIDHTSIEGATEMPYAVPHRRIELHTPEVDVSTLWWRSVGHTHTAFAGEHFLDILARQAGADPVAYRRSLLGTDGDPRLRGVLDLAAEKAGWGKGLPSGHAHGVALKKSFSSYVCQVFECSLADDGVPIVHRVTCAVDVGTPINPWNIEQQVQGAIVFGMTAALYGSIDLRDGRVRQSNFHDYRALRMHEMPHVDVHIVPSNEAPTGIGEPGLPPVAPAMANARLALSGEPTWQLPFAGEASS